MSELVSIHRVGVVSPLGIGFAAFSAALRAPSAPAAARAELSASRRIDDFNADEQLGERRGSSLDRMTQLAIAAVGQVLSAEGALSPQQRKETGVVLGSTGGGLGSITDFVRTTYTADQPHLVSPLQVPNTVMNCAASQCAIWHGLKGVNASICAGEISGAAALLYAVRLLQARHAEQLVAGAIEEYSEFIAQMHHAQSRPPMPFSEGGAVFLLRRGAPAGAGLATVLGIRTCVLGSDADTRKAADMHAQTVARLLASAQVDPAELRWRSGPIPAKGQADRAAAGAFDALAEVPDLSTELCGNSHGASTALQLAGALAIAPPGLGLLSAISPQRMLACVLIDKHTSASGDQQ